MRSQPGTPPRAGRGRRGATTGAGRGRTSRRAADGAAAAARAEIRPRPSTPLYLQLARTLIDEIQSGRFPVGSLLPREVELAAMHRVSRQTVRHAIAELRHKGLVSARKGVGTRVESIKAARRFNYSAQSVGDLFAMAAESEMTVETRAMTVARGRLAARLGCRSGHRWLHLGCLRRVDGDSRPLCWTDIFVDGRLAPILRDQTVFRSAVFGLIEREAGESVVEIQQEIRAVTLADAHARRLGAAPAIPALEITRRYFSTGRRLIQVSVSVLPSDRFFYSVEILRDRVSAGP